MSMANAIANNDVDVSSGTATIPPPNAPLPGYVLFFTWKSIFDFRHLHTVFTVSQKKMRGLIADAN